MLMRKKIIDAITAVLGVQDGIITEDTIISDVPDWDSLAHIMIIGTLEEQFGIEIPLDQAIEIASVAELFEKAGV